MLNAVDYTYQQANGQPFTYSTVTNPYGYNTTWAYLYSWYGQSKYNYVPEFFGPDQTGIFGGDLRSQAATPSALHFGTIEPDRGIPSHLFTFFKQDQEYIVGPAKEVKVFGTVKVNLHQYQP